MLLPSSRKPLLKPGAFSSNLSFQEKSLPNKQQYLLFQPSSCFSEETDRVYLIKKNLGRRSCSVEKGGGRREEGEKGEKRKEGGRGARMGEGAGGTIVEEKEGKMKKIGGREDEKREEEWKCFECAEMKKSLKSLTYKYDCERQKCSNMETEQKKLKTVLEEERNKYENKLTLFGDKISELKKLQNFYMNEKEKCQKLEKTLKNNIQKFEEIAISLVNHDSFDDLTQNIIEILQIVEINPKLKNLFTRLPSKNNKREEDEEKVRSWEEEEEVEEERNKEEEGDRRRDKEEKERREDEEKKEGKRRKEEETRKEEEGMRRKEEEERRKKDEGKKRKEEENRKLGDKKNLKRCGSQKENNLRLSNSTSFCPNPFRKDKSNIFFPLFPSPPSSLPSCLPPPSSSPPSSKAPYFLPPSSSLPSSSSFPAPPLSSFPPLPSSFLPPPSSSLLPPSPFCKEDDLNYETFKSNIEVSTEGNQDLTLTFDVESDKENRGGVENEAKLEEGKKEEKGKKEGDEYVTAKYDYTPKKENDLSLKVGDRVQILKKTKNGWWIGMLNEKIGYFPYNYVD